MDEIPVSLMIMAIIAIVAILVVLLLMGYFDGIIKYWSNETQNEENKVQKQLAGYNSNYCIKTIGDICIGI